MKNSQEWKRRFGWKLNLVLLLDPGRLRLSYGMIRWKGKAVGSFPTEFRPDVRQPGYLRQICRRGYRAEETASKVESTAPHPQKKRWERAFRSAGVHLISVPIDTSENTLAGR